MIFALIIAALPSIASTDTPTLTVETWNLGISPGLTADVDAHRTATLTALQRSDADILCLQEVWNAHDRDEILASLQPTYLSTPLLPRVDATREDGPACERQQLVGDGKVATCARQECAAVDVDSLGDCVLDSCGESLTTLIETDSACGYAYLSQLGTRQLRRPWRLTTKAPFDRFAYSNADGLMLLSKHSLAAPRSIDLASDSTLHRRGALTAQVTVEADTVTVVCAQLGAADPQRIPYTGAAADWSAEHLAQTTQILGQLSTSEATVLMGDFGCSSEGTTAPCDYIASEGFADPKTELVDDCIHCSNDQQNDPAQRIFVRGLTPRDGGEVLSTEPTNSDARNTQRSGYRLALRLGNPPPDPSREEATAFAHRADAELRYLWRDVYRKAWAYETNLTDDNETDLVAAEAKSMAWMTENIPRAARYLSAPDLDPATARQLHLLTIATTLPAPVDAARREQLAAVAARLNGMYGKGKHCEETEKETVCRDLGDLEEVLRESNDWEEQLEAWEAWRTVSPPMRPIYEEFVQLGNEGALELGYPDMGELWRGGYDMTAAELERETERLWQQVRPLYEQLHCYARRKLVGHYGASRVDPTGLIPAHVTGNMWAQSWEGMFPLLEPYPDSSSLDVTGSMQSGGWTPMRIAKTGEDFFTSLSLDPMPSTFWERSMFEQPEDREVVCHASAWDVELADDQRVKMCIRPTLDDLITMHHELGHNYYGHYHADLPILFQNGAHDGFHEAIGDAIALSITPEYLHKLGLTEQVSTSEEALLNKQMLDALQKVAFLPFGRMIDQWRWDVFSGKVAPEQWNHHWWSLRAEYQGIGAASTRPTNAFDPGAKFHIPANTPYLRYFLASILQFQMHEAMCAAAGHDGPLHTCSVYGSSEAGDRMRSVLELGASQPWPDALEAMTGTREMDATALLTYFSPLQEYLSQQNRGESCGWDLPEAADSAR